MILMDYISDKSPMISLEWELERTPGWAFIGTCGSLDPFWCGNLNQEPSIETNSSRSVNHCMDQRKRKWNPSKEPQSRRKESHVKGLDLATPNEAGRIPSCGLRQKMREIFCPPSPLNLLRDITLPPYVLVSTQKLAWPSLTRELDYYQCLILSSPNFRAVELLKNEHFPGMTLEWLTLRLQVNCFASEN